jgi:hypothetical protein
MILLLLFLLIEPLKGNETIINLMQFFKALQHLLHFMRIRSSEQASAILITLCEQDMSMSRKTQTS